VYEVEVREKIERLKLEANVTLTTEFLPEDVVQGALMAADVIVLPYHPTEESASAALRFVLPLGKPLVATDLPIFADAPRRLAVGRAGRRSGTGSSHRRGIAEPTDSTRAFAPHHSRGTPIQMVARCRSASGDLHINSS